jgi:NADH-quinone oxidoreductase subunit G
MAEVWIDGQRHEVDPGRNVLQVCLELGRDLPYFCWHPELGSVGACRLCAVKQFKDADDTQGKLVMACMTPAKDGTRIAIDDPEARAFRQAVIEWLMINHPLDCPVCDEGGECHLQDMTVMAGHVYRRHRFRKRTYTNQDLGPLVNHEMNRCIQCYRCTRFYRDFAGYDDLQEFGVHDRLYFGRKEDGPLESPFAGNLVEVCPTGVFTDKSLKRHYTRKWDLRTAPAVCQHCAVGCNTTPGERDGTLRRIRTRYHARINGYFLCDRGRYGYEFVNHERRLRQPLQPRGDHAKAVTLDEDAALRAAATLLGGSRPLVGIGSPRASLEANGALRTLVGAENFHGGVSADEAAAVAAVLEVHAAGDLPTPGVREAAACDAVLVLGEDPGRSAPLLQLSLRQVARRQPEAAARARGVEPWDDAALREMVQDRRGPLDLATPAATELDRDATAAWRELPRDAARLGHAVARALDPDLPAVPDLGEDVRAEAARVATSLRKAARPLVVSGTTAGRECVAAAAAVARALGRVRESGPADILLTVPECNSLGLGLLTDTSLADAVEAADGAVVVVLENDLAWRAPAAVLQRLREVAAGLVVIDHTAHVTGAMADLLLPSATYAEAAGTVVNLEGRAQRSHPVMPATGAATASWRWLRRLALAAGRATDTVTDWQHVDDVAATLAACEPVLARLPELALHPERHDAGGPVPRESARASGRTARHAASHVHEPAPPSDPDSALTHSMEGYQGRATGREATEFWSPGWNSNQALNRFQEEIAGPLRGGDPGVRLFGGRGDPATPAPAARPPAAWSADGDALCPVPLPEVFGGDELSRLAPSVAELAPAPAVALHPETARDRGLAEGAPARVRIGDDEWTLPVRHCMDLHRHAAGLPVGHAGLPRSPGPRTCEVTRP